MYRLYTHTKGGGLWVEKNARNILNGSKNTVSRSKNSFFLDLYDKIPTPDGLRIQLGATVASLGRKMKEAYGVELDDLQKLDTIYLVRIDGRTSISRVSEEQQAVISKPGIKMEVR